MIPKTVNVEGMQYSVYDKKSRKHFINWYLEKYKPLGEKRQAIYSKRLNLAKQKKRTDALCTPEPLEFPTPFSVQNTSQPIVKKVQPIVKQVQPRVFKRSNALYGTFSLYNLRTMGIVHQLEASEIAADVSKILERLTKLK